MAKAKKQAEPFVLICPHCGGEAEPVLTEARDVLRAVCVGCNRFMRFVAEDEDGRIPALLAKQMEARRPKGGL